MMYERYEFKTFDDMIKFLESRRKGQWDGFYFEQREDVDICQKIYCVFMVQIGSAKNENLKEILEESSKNKIL